MRLWLASMCGVLALAGCGGSASGGSSHAYKNLRRVSITLGNSSLPPPFGRPKTTVYSTPAELARVTAKLNAYRIGRQSQTSPNDGGCAGGYQVAISIVKPSSPPVRLSGYRCATTTYGLTGNLPGFLASLGLSPPG
jgi:hypothetical protein